MGDNDDSTNRHLPEALYGCARVFVAIFGSIIAGIGVVGICQVGGWWLVIVWLLLAFGIYLVGLSLFGKRESIDHIVTEFLSSILEKMF